MKVVVCIKQVPDTKGGVKFNPDGTLDRAAMMTIMNPDDMAIASRSTSSALGRPMVRTVTSAPY